MSIASYTRVALATLAVGGSTLAATAALTASPAEAHRRLVFRTGLIYRPLLVSRVYLKPRYIVPVVATAATVIAVSSSCAKYRWRAEAYNSSYWWERYNACMGY